MNRPENAFDRDASLALKGVAILMMLFFHCFQNVEQIAPYGLSFFPFRESSVVNIATACKICVSIFAFISGYGLYLSYRDRHVSPTRWCVKRYIRTFSGYWLVWCLSAAFFQCVDGRVSGLMVRDGRLTGAVYCLIDFCGLAALFRTPMLNGNWWYFTAALAFIALTPLMHRWRRALWLALIGAVMLPRVMAAQGAEVYTGHNSVYAFLTPYMLGCIFAEHGYFERWRDVGGGRRWTKGYKLIVELWLVALGYKLYHHLPIAQFWEYHFGLFALLVIMVCVEYVLPLRWPGAVLRFLGRHSANIFMVHTFIRLYYCMDFTYSWRHFALVVLVLLGVSLGISMAIEWLKKLVRYPRFVGWLEARI